MGRSWRALALACCFLRCLAVVTSHTERLQVGSIKACAPVLHRHHVVHNHGRHYTPARSTQAAQRMLTQESGSHGTPLG